MLFFLSSIHYSKLLKTILTIYECDGKGETMTQEASGEAVISPGVTF